MSPTTPIGHVLTALRQNDGKHDRIRHRRDSRFSYNGIAVAAELCSDARVEMFIALSQAGAKWLMCGF
jgi:hypothetical protein